VKLRHCAEDISGRINRIGSMILRNFIVLFLFGY